MVNRVILLSGSVASGKTTLSDALVSRYRFERLKTRDVIHAIAGTTAERGPLQEAGERLDRETGGRWVVEALARLVSHLGENVTVVVDAVRTEAQVEAIRREFGLRTKHVHLTASDDILARRYRDRSRGLKEFTSYDEVRANATESGVEKLKDIADVVIDTARSSPDDVFVRVASHLGVDAEELRKAEKTSTTKRDRRVGEFDWALLRSATSLNGPTDVALTFVDYIHIANKDARRFEQLTPETIRFIEEVERVTSAPVSLITTRFHLRSIIDRRRW